MICHRCGAAPDEPVDTVPLGWSTATAETRTGDGFRVLCPTCTRGHLRAIESKLDEEWWG